MIPELRIEPCFSCGAQFCEHRDPDLLRFWRRQAESARKSYLADLAEEAHLKERIAVAEASIDAINEKRRRRERRRKANPNDDKPIRKMVARATEGTRVKLLKRA